MNRTRAGWDIALSIVFLVVNAAVFLGGAFFAVFVLAFTDNCPPGCDIPAGVDAMYTVGLVITLVGIVATIVTIVLLVTRRRAWWVGLVALVLTGAGWVIAIALYSAAISPG